MHGKSITTIEGLGDVSHLHPIQQAFIDAGAVQCGYCTPGQFTVAKYIIETYGQPTAEQIREELSGNICRCGTYSRHVAAIQEAAAAIAEGQEHLPETDDETFVANINAATAREA